MNKVPFLWAAGFASLAALAMSMPAFAAECPLRAEFKQAIQAKNLGKAKEIETRIKGDARCDTKDALDTVRDRAALEVTMAGEATSAEEREKLLIDADQPDVFWAAAASLGELRYDQKRYAEAFKLFERAIEDIKNRSKTVNAPDAKLIEQIRNFSTAARQLAANEDTGKAVYVASAKDHRDGKLGGAYSVEVRDIKMKSVPLPINFKYASDEFTDVGRQYADELLQAIKEQAPGEVIIVGHTDPRGADDYNMDLSERRARAVAKFLASNGVTAKIKTFGRGWHEQVPAEVTKGLSDEEVWALDRRVEWRRP